MKQLGNRRGFVAVIVMAVLLALAMPATSFGKDRGRRNGRGGNWDKKCAKFVNCHDARDGRWDGLGRRRNARDWRDGRWWDNRTGDRGWWGSGSRDNRWWSRNGDNRWRDDNRWRNRNADDRRRENTRRRSRENRWWNN